MLLTPALVIAIPEIERNCRLEKHYLLLSRFALHPLACVCQHGTPHAVITRGTSQAAVTGASAHLPERSLQFSRKGIKVLRAGHHISELGVGTI